MDHYYCWSAIDFPSLYHHAPPASTRIGFEMPAASRDDDNCHPPRKRNNCFRDIPTFFHGGLIL
jgi:hypothetical protein